MRPSGTVVFLFSDIEGSTARWEAQPDAMRDAVRRHDEIVRTAMENRGGYVFKTVGDAFCVAFTTAPQALQAALQAQRDLRAQEWGSVDGLRVRMAVHAGNADERAGDYFGSAVNRVARLLAAAHGDQIVLSGTVADLLNTDLPAGVSLRPLGTFRLKDLRQPERVFQIAARDLPKDFKPLRTLEAVPNNLPPQTTGFIGREQDIARIRDLLRNSSLVTIAGAGGVGKTRIALQCAADAIDRMNDGVWFVNLAPLSDPALVSSTILHTLHTAVGDSDPLEALLSHLASRELLMVLDNCEHVIEEAARVVGAIRERCRRVTLLATSREALHLEGERVYRLPPLDASDALRLFVQRAQAADSRFELNDANAPIIEDICRHLDGIPLAIELAAARVRVLSLEDLSRRLGERFRLLTGGNRTALPRQQTLHALIDWSHELLTDNEKTLFRRVSIFSGGFTLDAASAVCSDEALDEWTILDLLASLVDKSLVVADLAEKHPRYHLLESIQEYARRKLAESDSATELGERHARFFAEMAAKLYSEWDRNPSTAAITRVLLDLDNVRSALHWTLEDAHDPQLGAQLAADIAPAFIQLSLLGEGISWCNRALDSVEGLRPAVQARLEYVLSMFFNNQALYAQALAAAERAVALYRRTDDDRGTIRAFSQVAQQYARAGRFDDAKPYANEAIDRARATGDAQLFAGVTRRCAFSLPPSEIEQARSQFSGAVAILRSLHADDEVCQLLEWWAEAEAAAGCFERAIEIGTQALNCAGETARMHRASNIAGYALAAGDFERAVPFTREALTLAMQAQHQLLTAIAIAYFAAIRAPDDAREAARLFGYARAQMSAMKWSGIASDKRARENIVQDLGNRIGDDDLFSLFAEGEAWSSDEALAHTQT